MHSSSARVENFAGGIIRRVDDDGLGGGSKRGRQFFRIERPIGRTQLDVARSGAGKNRIGAVIFVEGLEDDDFVARIDDGHHRRTSSPR